MKTFHLAVCKDCQPVLPMPFEDETKRDSWLRDHVRATGHSVERKTEFRLSGGISTRPRKHESPPTAAH